MGNRNGEPSVKAGKRPIRIALLGTGAWARQYHLPALKVLEGDGDLQIAGVWNRTTEMAKRVARQFRVSRIYRSLDEVVGDPVLDGFVVIVNSAALKEMISRLLPRGLPIFTEKPPGRSYAETRELARLVRVPNLVAFNRRYMPINRRYKELVEGMRRPYFAECHFYRNQRHHEHFVMETGIHGINFMEHLCGRIRTVRTERRWSASGVDLWICSVVFESGLRGILKFFPCCGSSLERYEVHGPDSSIYLHCPQTYTTDHPGQIVVHEKGKSISTIQDEDRGALVTAGFVDEYRDFVQAARGGQVTASNFLNSCSSMRIAEAIESTEGAGQEMTFPSGESG
jgi:myo-inositol 2-dehydrogenase / D-chiro-inositol 1-dehydrogenase